MDAKFKVDRLKNVAEYDWVDTGLVNVPPLVPHWYHGLLAHGKPW
ncbi:hypothetical protein Nizo1840_0161 [Lactiplantibacillus plantarum]|jgi:hypothetical protein|nr:hypothetical protein Nizo1840_0161 [Lactiplantibacillus plantarum]